MGLAFIIRRGNAHAKPVVCYAGNKIFEFKAEK